MFNTEPDGVEGFVLFKTTKKLKIEVIFTLSSFLLIPKKNVINCEVSPYLEPYKPQLLIESNSETC